MPTIKQLSTQAKSFATRLANLAWDPSKYKRGKTTPGSRGGSFAPKGMKPGPQDNSFWVGSGLSSGKKDSIASKIEKEIVPEMNADMMWGDTIQLIRGAKEYNPSWSMEDRRQIEHSIITNLARDDSSYYKQYPERQKDFDYQKWKKGGRA